MRDSLVPVRLAIVNDFEVVVAGLASMLEEHRDRVHVVEIVAGSPVLSAVDVVLVDTFGHVPRAGSTLRDLISQTSAPVVLYSWEMPRDGIARALAAGAGGYLSKALTATDMVDALEAIRDGETVVRTSALMTEEPLTARGWPGRAEGLTPRESEVLSFITQGLSNQQVADACHLSINSIKTYIRSAYQKIGVRSRSQAVGWGMRNGFEPATMRRTFSPSPSGVR